MRSAFFLGIALALLVGCSSVGEIRITRDDFKNITLLNLDLIHETQETETSGIVSKSFQGYFEYSRELGPTEKKPIKVRVGLSVGASSENFSPKGFLRIDESTFPLELTDISGNVLSGVSTGTAYGTTYGTTNGFVDYSKPNYNSRVTTVSTYNYKRLTGNFLLPRELEKNILTCDKLIYRIYVGDSSYTFSVDSSDLDTLKDFLVSRGQ
ncbi:hypothetical protein [Leptospira wolffii]|uniref:hypothetical protein n=1 Tax=Leptospira wolffii TaxID=409998 RepID=UPI000349AF08|nr:hypothetical protein [Leptospira wolffii]